MSESGKEKLRSLLFCGDENLVNLKLFPGTDSNLSADSMAESAEEILSAAKSAWANGVPSQPPSTGMDKRPLVG